MSIRQKGFGVVEVLIISVVLGLICFIGWLFLKNNTTAPTGQIKQTEQTSIEKPVANNSRIDWQFDMKSGEWKPSSKPPECKDPFTFDVSPVAMSQATAVLYPGQTRGGNYKVHGGFAFDNRHDNNVAVTMPYDAYLVSGSRYYEAGELQYILDFTSDCGIAIRFDHLATLSSKLDTIVASLPEPKPDDSRGASINPPVLFKTGESIATAIGFKNNLNVGMDFGVYDYRQPNDASKNTSYQKAHSDFSATTYYGVCWFDMLPGKDATIAKSLPSRDQSMGKTSDYCK